MQITTLHLHPQFVIDTVSPRLFGGFLEHMGRSIYEGIYDPASSRADADGLRGDVLDALARLDFSVVRYPGGNFVSGYHWQDGVGPRSERPTVRELAWNTIEPNQFGTDEFLALAERMGWAPMLAVNLGTGTPEEACQWLEYCNGEAGTRYADQRVANGRVEPWKVPLWCLGNEMDGPWQLGHVPADHYAIKARQSAKLMKDLDRSIELVLCGSSNVDSPTYMSWDREVLERAGDLVDYLSVHRYVGNSDDDTPDFLAITNAIDRQIEESDAVCRFVSAKRRSWRRVYLCFDEWNVWYKTISPEGLNPDKPFPRPLIEEVYNLEDALVVAGFLNSFIRHADSVKIANIAQMVNVIAPVLTRGDRVLIQSIFHVLEIYGRRRRGVSLRSHVVGPRYTGRKNGEVSYLDASAIRDGDRLHVFMTNRSVSESAPVRIELAGGAKLRLASGEIVTGKGPKEANTLEEPDKVRAAAFDQVKVDGGVAVTELPALSVAALTLEMS
jgi:alpha-N-arabinofuranosidase